MVYFVCLEIVKENNCITELNGRIGDIKYTGISSDLNVASNNIVQVMKYNSDTLNTPQKEGITVSGDGVVISYSNNTYGIQVCAAQATDTLFVRKRADTTWAQWKKLVSSNNIQFITKGNFSIEITNTHETRITIPGNFQNLDNYFVVIIPGGSEIMEKTWAYYIRESNANSFVAGFSISSPGTYNFKYIVIA